VKQKYNALNEFKKLMVHLRDNFFLHIADKKDLLEDMKKQVEDVAVENVKKV